MQLRELVSPRLVLESRGGWRTVDLGDCGWEVEIRENGMTIKIRNSL